MYIQRIQLENIRSHAKLELEFDENESAGWHVILGENGAGKSTLVRALALALVGPVEAAALRQDWRDWLRVGTKHGHILAHIRHDAVDRQPDGREGKSHDAGLTFQRGETTRESPVTMKAMEAAPNPHSFAWGTGKGWFSASYGPFRRFTGGNKDYEKLFYSNAKLAPHLTVFGEDVALTEALAWLQKLWVLQLEGQLDSTTVDKIVRFINDSGLLPHHTRIEKITSTTVLFRDGSGCSLPIEQLSDGYRSILSLTLELIRQLAHAYGREVLWAHMFSTTIVLPGVVIIDEIDAHLHPTWQRRIGQWFREHFPQIQFIVTTHSPLICQAATVGSIWLLGKPGEPGVRKIEGTLRDRLVYGSVLDALDTDLFGEDVARSDLAQKMLVRLAELNLRSLRGQLSADERKELESLRRTFPAEADIEVAAK